MFTRSAAPIFQPTDTQVIDWTDQYYRSLRPPAQGGAYCAVATGTDLEVVVVNAADQVAEQHVPGRGDAGHLITGVNVWPLADPDYDEVLITVTLAQAPWTRLASEPIDITTFIAPANGAAPGGREVISHALTEVLTTARHLLADHQNLRQPAGAAARAWQRLRRPLRRV